MANCFTSWAVDFLARGVGRVTHHGRDNLHAGIGKRRAVNVGQIIVDLSVRPGELELRDRSALAGRQLDGDANTRLGVGLRVAATKDFHVRVHALAD